MNINIGVSETDRQEIAGQLSRLLADSYTLYLKTHNYHWNVTGPQFNTLHTMFEVQYAELAIAVDEVVKGVTASETLQSVVFACFSDEVLTHYLAACQT